MEEIIDVIKKIENVIYITGHKNADYDSLCSSLGFTIALNKLGKIAYFLIEEKDKVKLKYFKSEDYMCTSIDEKNYSFILLDSNRISRMPDEFEKYYNSAKLKINIDHHEGNTTGAEYVLSINDISSTCEIIYELLEKMSIKLDLAISELIFVGIVSDTDLFCNRTTSRTMKIASNLIELGVNNKMLIEKFYLNKTPDEMRAISDMVSKMRYDKFHYIVINMDEDPYNKVDYITISKKCMPILFSDEEIKVLMVCMNFNGKIKGEIRSRGNINVAKLAKLLIGGGHTNASGFSNKKSVSEIIEITNKYLEDIENE